MTPGTQNSSQVVFPDAKATRQHLLVRGVEAPPVQKLTRGSITSLRDPDANAWTLRERPPPGCYGALGR